MSVSERVKVLLNNAGISQKDFAIKLAISAPRLNNYLADRHEIPQALLVKIAELTNSELGWILTGTGSIYKEPTHARDPIYDIITLPVVADIAAGTGIEAEDIEPREHISVPALLLPTSGPYYCFRVSGISMEPELHTGDYAIVAGFRFDEDYNGAICAFRSIDGLLIKRLVVDHKGKRSLLIPLNPSQPIQIYDETSPEITLIGRLITVIRKYM